MSRRTKTQKHTLTREMIKATFACTHCQEDNEMTMQDISFSGSSSECELCGSHGSVDMSLTCQHCGQWFDIELSSW